MPTLKAARRQTSGSAPNADFGSVWNVLDAKNVLYEGQGVYSYVGAGTAEQEDIGLIKTRFPLDPYRMGGISSFEITLIDPGKHSTAHITPLFLGKVWSGPYKGWCTSTPFRDSQHGIYYAHMACE